MVIDKPAGLPLDPGRQAEHGDDRARASLADWLPLLQLGRRHMPHPAHRLDTDTAGCLVLGRTKPALAALNALFAARRAEKTYWAVVTGTPPSEGGMLDAPLRKISTQKAGWRMETHPDGQPARTEWRVLGRAEGPGGPLAWLELRPATGRTHQLRVHCAHLGCPILGDPLYGSRPRPAAHSATPPTRGPAPAAPHAPMHLLARAIELPADPAIGAALAATAPIPATMRPAFTRCGAPPEPPPPLVTKV